MERFMEKISSQYLKYNLKVITFFWLNLHLMPLKIKYTTEILFEYAGYACINNILSIKTRRKTDGDWYEDGVTPALSLAIEHVIGSWSRHIPITR